MKDCGVFGMIERTQSLMIFVRKKLTVQNRFSYARQLKKKDLLGGKC